MHKESGQKLLNIPVLTNVGREGQGRAAKLLYHARTYLSSIIYSSNYTKNPRRPIRGFLSVLFYWLAVSGQLSAYSYRGRLRYSPFGMGSIGSTPQEPLGTRATQYDFVFSSTESERKFTLRICDLVAVAHREDSGEKCI